MPQLPVNTENDVAIQSNSTGAVDYLQYQGNTLIHSDLVDYGLGPSWNVVAHGDFNGDGHPDLVMQNASTGQVDFLFLNQNAQLIGSALSATPLPHIVGGGDFQGIGDLFTNQMAEPLVAQLPNGQLDFLAFNGSGQLIGSDLLANTVGLPKAVGVAEGSSSFQPFSGSGTGFTDNVVTQLADGSLDVLGFSGSFAPQNPTLAFSSSLMLPGTAGSAPVGAINQDVGLDTNTNIRDPSNGHEGVQMISQLASGQLDTLWFDSGYHDAANAGVEYASNLGTTSFAGFHVVDAGAIATNLFPIS
jgi:hypothetical protein